MESKKTNKLVQKRDSVCEVCVNGYQCGKLSGALDILKAAVGDADVVSREEYAEIHDRLRENEFAYPQSIKFCELKGNSAELNDLIEQATNVLENIRRKKNKVG